MTVIPIAPGTQLDISSPDYPRVYGSDVSKEVLTMSPRPIIIIRNKKDASGLSRLKILKESPQLDAELEELERNEQALWLLPTGRAIKVKRDAKNLQEAVIAQQKEASKKRDDTDSPKKPQLTDE